jgi:phospholipid/cholesterol/gamma-HCH transport system ATP-binding protein
VDIEEHIWKMPDELSGGQQKRVGLARALAENPKILLYDEPTTGLDPITTHEVDQLIKRTRDEFNVTSIVISHDIPSVFDISDRIVFLYKGELVQIGTVDEIRNSEHPYVKKFVQTAQRGKK